MRTKLIVMSMVMPVVQLCVLVPNRRDFVTRVRGHHARWHRQCVVTIRRAHLAEDAWLFVDIAERKRPQPGPQRHQPDDHPEIADAVDDERFVGGG